MLAMHNVCHCTNPGSVHVPPFLAVQPGESEPSDAPRAALGNDWRATTRSASFLISSVVSNAVRGQLSRTVLKCVARSFRVPTRPLSTRSAISRFDKVKTVLLPPRRCTLLLSNMISGSSSTRMIAAWSEGSDKPMLTVSASSSEPPVPENVPLSRLTISCVSERWASAAAASNRARSSGGQRKFNWGSERAIQSFSHHRACVQC